MLIKNRTPCFDGENFVNGPGIPSTFLEVINSSRCLQAIGTDTSSNLFTPIRPPMDNAFLE